MAILGAALCIIGQVPASAQTPPAPGEGKVFTVVGAGDMEEASRADREGMLATLTEDVEPSALVLGSDGSVLIGSTSGRVSHFENAIIRLSPKGRLTTFALGVAEPEDILVTAEGRVLVVDRVFDQVFEVTSSRALKPVAGRRYGRGHGGDDGPARRALLNAPSGLASTEDGGYLIADTGNSRVRRVWPDGRITTVAGTGVPGNAGDGGPAELARLTSPYDVADLGDGGYLIADAGSNVVRRVEPDGVISTVAGTGRAGFRGDGGAATEGALRDPHAVTPTADGGFLIADTGNKRVRRVAPNGVITTVAGVGRGVDGQGRHRGDGGPATAAGFNGVESVIEAPDGGLLIGDTFGTTLFASGGTVRYVKPHGGTRLAVAPQRRAARSTRSRYRLPIFLSVSAKATLRVRRRGHVIAAVSVAAPRGASRVELTRRIKPGPYHVRLDTETTEQRAAQEYWAFLGGRLPRAWARRQPHH